MQKHFLVTISNDVESLSGVQFICSFFRTMSQHRVTLFHLCRLDAGDMKSELMKMWDGPCEDIQGQVSVGARRSLDKAVQLLKKRELLIDQMITKTVAERAGKVRDILAEGVRGLYDAVVLGRRASYTLQWLVERPADEIAQTIIRDHRFTMPVWVCPPIDRQRRNVLLCLDGSENAYRAADHVGYMVADQEQHRITLLQVSGLPGNGDETVFNRAAEVLHGHNIADDRIERQTAWGISVPGTILGTAEKGGYAAVAVGLGGSGRHDSQSFRIAGGTSARLICRNEVTSLWCCP